MSRCTWYMPCKIYAFELIQDEKYLEDAEKALFTCKNTIATYTNNNSNNFSFDFSLCHGLSGICEPILYASELLHNKIYKKIYENLATYGITRYNDNNQQWPCGIKTGPTPNLMLGIAGIGYFYLRVFNPQDVPSILMISK